MTARSHTRKARRTKARNARLHAHHLQKQARREKRRKQHRPLEGT